MHHSFCASNFLQTSKQQLFSACFWRQRGWLPATDLADEATKQPQLQGSGLLCAAWVMCVILYVVAVLQNSS